MGVWGAGLYSGDYAMDLRSTISAVARLPFDAGKLLEILWEISPAAANKVDDPDHTTFWLIVADQFAKRAIVSDRARDTALAIIDNGGDIALLSTLGMSASELTKRRKMLAELRTRIVAPVASRRPRPVLKKPQPLLMDIGDVFVYPTFGGRCINSYFASKELDNKYQGKDGPTCWKQDGWSAMVIVDRGRAFDFLAWYRPLTVCSAVSHKPALEALRGEVLWKLVHEGTCSKVHFKRLELERLGNLSVANEKLRRAFPGIKPGLWAVVQDISICNVLNVGPAVPDALMPKPGTPLNFSRGRPYPTILGIEQIFNIDRT
jgi:hypothetical protein